MRARRSGPTPSAMAYIVRSQDCAPIPRSCAAQAASCLRGVLPLLLPARSGGPATGPFTSGTRCGNGIYSQSPNHLEVILTGGDPLLLSPQRLATIVQALDTIEHIKIIRVHTRVPVVAPARVTSSLVRALKTKAKATYVVLHANHARELSPNSRQACARLVDGGIPMLSQTVLLRGVNDDAQSLGDLMRVLVECRVKPYYLHHCDLAPGTSHWRTSIEEGQALARALRGRLSGLCQPTYVLDIPGGHGKSPIGPSYLRRAGKRNGSCEYVVEDFNGGRHAYPPKPKRPVRSHAKKTTD